MKKRVLQFLFLLLLIPTLVFAKGENEVTIISNTYNYKPLLGFSYVLVDQEGKEIAIDLTEKESMKLTLSDGTYTLKEVGRPKGYQEAKELSFTLPYTLNGVATNRMVVYPKHTLLEESSVEKPHESSVETPIESSKTVPTKNFPGVSSSIGLETGRENGMLALKLLWFGMFLGVLFLSFVFYQKGRKEKRKEK